MKKTGAENMGQGFLSPGGDSGVIRNIRQAAAAAGDPYSIAAQGRSDAAATQQDVITQGWKSQIAAQQEKVNMGGDAPAAYQAQHDLGMSGAGNTRRNALASAAATTRNLSQFQATNRLNPMASQQATLASGQQRGQQIAAGEASAATMEIEAKQALVEKANEEIKAIDARVALGELEAGEAEYLKTQLNEAAVAGITEIQAVNESLKFKNEWFNDALGGASGIMNAPEDSPWSDIYYAIEAELDSLSTQDAVTYYVQRMNFAKFMSQKMRSEDAAYMAGLTNVAPGDWQGYGYDEWFDPHDYGGPAVGV